MTNGARAALAAVLVAAGLALPAPGPASAASCVQVIVDYTSPGRTCAGGAGMSAADVLAARARALGRPAPRYSNSGFLCAIDGKPESGCGEEAGQPYWSFWYWRNGAWVYSNVGVHTFEITDGDRDGHLDPLGFRYHPPKEKAPPRARPVFAASSTKPPTRPPATRPATPAPGPGATRQPGARPASGTTPAATRKAPGATAAPAAPSTAPATAAVSAAAGATAVPAPSASSEEVREDLPAPVAARRAKHFPYGTVLGGALALALLAAAAVRARKPGAR